jgi:hypothetical protein
MWFRLILQPVMAAIMATRDGLRDARSGRPPYVWLAIHQPDARGGLMREGLRHIARVLVLGVVMDAIYQWIALRWVYVGEMLVVVIVLVVVPYVLLRGIVTRLARRRT